LAALIATQKAARQANKTHKEGILVWSDKPRLMDVLQVEPQWQSVCEMVLGEALHAYVLDDFDELWPHWQSCEQQGESVVTMRTPLVIKNPRERLSDKVKGAVPATLHNLDHIYIADHLDEAVNWLPDLSAHESIVTINGFWLGKGWVKLVNPGEQDEIGLLARQQKIAELALIVDELRQKIETVRLLRDESHSQLQQNLSFIELYQLNLNSSNDALRLNISAVTGNEQAIQHAEKILATIGSEYDELQNLLEDLAGEDEVLKEKLNLLEDQYNDAEQQQHQVADDKQTWLNKLTLLNKQVEEFRNVLHQTELGYDREITKIQQVTDRINREQERLDILQERLEHLAFLCLQSQEPGAELQEQLTELLMRHGEVESQLTLSRERLAQIRIDLETLEKATMSYDLEVKRVQELIGQTRMDEQALSVRASSVQESLDELGLQAQNILDLIPAGITQSMREDELISITERIKRLGAINLAAIEEFATEQQRKLYLDEQYEDLNQALTTLETAIEKMDKETRLRLENTFDEVNTSFKALFPRLFGGGRAQLELTCDNLLEAGIVVMAQPPGKRNSTIHLLSGGEKAMTAVALVFAIFQLNPSPFCMLDEVDAPLDDVNVGRFCDLVKEMSQFVQFLFITHNKVTMELADHLIGVTMREPGVSRLVAVDVKHALTME
ncbi:MAG: chromosome segregation protein SMC, partial [Gammaproteobacteria bacterium]|nr:chromosome segregation protein SMC [Gammaproteobacteria bacterium]